MYLIHEQAYLVSTLRNVFECLQAGQKQNWTKEPVLSFKWVQNFNPYSLSQAHKTIGEETKNSQPLGTQFFLGRNCIKFSTKNSISPKSSRRNYYNTVLKGSKNKKLSLLLF